MLLKTLYYINKARTLPPRILIKAIGKKLQRTLRTCSEMLRDRWKTSYSNSPYSLNQYVTPPEQPPATSPHLTDHIFDLLGSGPVHVKHGMHVHGIEGIAYPSQPALHIDSQGEWLHTRINNANVPYAQRVWQQIDTHYTPIDWHLDFKSGYRWSESTHSSSIQYGHLEGVDIKVPWELSRMQHLPQLAWAYHSSQDLKYVREFHNQVLDFIATNPPRFGVNWKCTMDVSIRVCNWLISYDLLRHYNAPLDSEFLSIFTSSIYDHGQHIFNHLEWMPEFRSNHYLANLVGLLFVAAYLPESAETNTWLNFAIKELIQEVPMQFHEEGSSFEGSTSYHCLSAQLVTYATALAILKQGDACFPKHYMERIEKMAQFVDHITKPDQTIVQVGDHDSGYLFKLFPPYDRPLERTHIIKEIDGLLHPNTSSEFLFKLPHVMCPASSSTRQPLRVISSGTSLDAWKQSIHTYDSTHIAFPCNLEQLSCYAYPQFGLYIYRSPHLFLSMRVGPLGQLGNGGHDHNDQLSVELIIEGEEIVVDPGTYLYTPLPKKRNDYRSVRAHFAPQIVGQEPSDLTQGLFMMRGHPQGTCVLFNQSECLGVHHGYGFPVYRLIELYNHTIHITDFSKNAPLEPIQDVLKRVQAMPFSPGYGIVRATDRPAHPNHVAGQILDRLRSAKLAQSDE